MPGPSKTVFELLAAAAAALAHLQPGSLSSPAAGQSYAASSQVKITWTQAEYHYGKYALAFSRNDGSTWEPIAVWTGPSGDDVTVNYTWTVPDEPGGSYRVRVCQIENCAESEYVLTSGAFTVTPSASVRPVASGHAPVLRFSAAEGRLEASYFLERPGRVTLEAFDSRGALVATLLDGAHAAGRHDIPIRSAALLRNAGLKFRLRLGGRDREYAGRPPR